LFKLDNVHIIKKRNKQSWRKEKRKTKTRKQKFKKQKTKWTRRNQREPEKAGPKAARTFQKLVKRKLHQRTWMTEQSKAGVIP
jgi:hypothetical protein